MEIKICMGTMCYIMGGAELCEVVDSLLAEEPERDLNITFSPCLGSCEATSGEAPYIEVDGEIVAGVSKKTLIEIIKNK